MARKAQKMETKGAPKEKANRKKKEKERKDPRRGKEKEKQKARARGETRGGPGKASHGKSGGDKA